MVTVQGTFHFLKSFHIILFVFIHNGCVTKNTINLIAHDQLKLILIACFVFFHSYGAGYAGGYGESGVKQRPGHVLS